MAHSLQKKLTCYKNNADTAKQLLAPSRSIASACCRQIRSRPFNAAWYDLSVQWHCHSISAAPVSCIIKSFNRDISWRIGATWSALHRPRSAFFISQLLHQNVIQLLLKLINYKLQQIKSAQPRRHFLKGMAWIILIYSRKVEEDFINNLAAKQLNTCTSNMVVEKQKWEI